MQTGKNNSNEGAQLHASHTPIGKDKHTIKSSGRSSSSSRKNRESEKSSINNSQQRKAESRSFQTKEEAIEQVLEGTNLNVENGEDYGSSASGRTSIEDAEAGTEGDKNF
jgi:hypothetical protein